MLALGGQFDAHLLSQSCEGFRRGRTLDLSGGAIEVLLREDFLPDGFRIRLRRGIAWGRVPIFVRREWDCPLWNMDVDDGGRGEGLLRRRAVLPADPHQ